MHALTLDLRVTKQHSRLSGPPDGKLALGAPEQSP